PTPRRNTRGDDVVLGADDQRWRLDPPQTPRPGEGEDRVDRAGRYLRWRKQRQVLRLLLTQPLVVASDPPAWIEEECIGLHIGAGAKAHQDVLPQAEEP